MGFSGDEYRENVFFILSRFYEFCIDLNYRKTLPIVIN